MRNSIFVCHLGALSALLFGCTFEAGEPTSIDRESFSASSAALEAAASHGGVRRCYSLRLLGTLGGPNSNALAINDRGQITGESSPASDPSGEHAFLWRHGRLRDLGTFGEPWSVGVAINDRGHVLMAAGSRALLWHEGEVDDLGTLGIGAQPVALNERDQVSGYSVTDGGPTHAFFWERGRIVDIGTLADTLADNSSMATGLNDRGQVIGRSYNSAGLTRGFLWQRGTIIDLGSPNGGPSDVSSINNRGEVVGSFGKDTSSGAFLWRAGTITDLGTLGGAYGAATSINDAGQIVGWSLTSSGEQHATLWDHGRIIDMGPGAAQQINERGQAIGNDSLFQPFVWESGVRTALPVLASSTQPRGINQKGEIAGIGFDADDNLQAFIWEPGCCP